MFEVFGLTSVAAADPIEPAKVRTTPIRPPSAQDHGEPMASPNDAAKVPPLTVLTVRPRSPEDDRDASGRELPAAPDPGHAASAADLHTVHTITIRPDRDAELASASRPLAAPNGDPNRHAVRTITIRPDRDAYPAYAPGTLPAPNSHPDRQSNDTIRDPSQFMPE